MTREIPFQWIDLCRSVLEPRLSAQETIDATSAALVAREAAGDPPPHFFGLFTVTHDRAAGLNKKGRSSYRELVSMVGSDHVHMRAVRAVHVDEERVRLEPAPVEDPASTST